MRRTFYKDSTGYRKPGCLAVGETVVILRDKGVPYEAKVVSIGREYFTVRCDDTTASIARRFQIGCSEGAPDCSGKNMVTVRIYASKSSCLDLLRREKAWGFVKCIVALNNSSEPPTQEELKQLEGRINEALAKDTWQ